MCGQVVKRYSLLELCFLFLIKDACTGMDLIEFRLECPAEFRGTELRLNFTELFSGSYGTPYFIRNPVYTKFRLPAEFHMIWNSIFYGFPYLYRIPYL